MNSKNTAFDRILKLEGVSCETFVYDFSARNGICSFVKHPDPAWAQQYLLDMLPSFHATIVWIYDTNFSCIYTASSSNEYEQLSLPLTKSELQTLLAQRYFHHFFALTSHGLFEIRSAPIHPQTDIDRISSPQGFMFVGRHWNQQYLDEITALTESEVSIHPIERNTPLPVATYNFEQGEIRFSRVLKAWDKTPIVELKVSSSVPVLAQLYRAERIFALQLLLFFCVIVFTLVITLTLWVRNPLATLTRSMRQQSPELLKGMERTGPEYATLSHLIIDFFKQKEDLAKEVLYRVRAHEELVALNKKLQARETELQAINEQLIAQQQMINAANQELRAANQQLKASQQDLIRANKLIEEIFDASIDGFVFADLNGTIIRANKAMHVMLGLNPTGMIGKHISEYVPAEETYKRRSLEFMTQLSRDGIVEHFETKLQGADRTVLVEISAVYVMDENNSQQGVLLCFRDITEQKRLQERLQQTQKMEAIGTLAGGIAHDFNNILAGIMGYTELMMNNIDGSSPFRKNIEQILKLCIRARDLVRQILTFSRKIEEEEYVPVRLNEVISDVIKLLRASIPTTIDIREHLCKESLVVKANPTSMHQMLMNLATNAAHAMSEHGGILEISLDTCAVDDAYIPGQFQIPPGVYARLRVADTGIGIAPEHISRIFDPFFTTKEVGKGTGMGLAVVYGIVKNHGGDINVTSQLGKGSVFEILLPIVAQQPVDQSARIQKDLPRGSEKILFVDDELVLVELWRQMLEALGYTVYAFDDCKKALECFMQDPYQFDLVITDQTMPKMTGDQLAKQILKIRPDVPIILCTGFSERISEDAAAQIGISALLIKPIRAPEIAQTIRRVIEHTTSMQ
ncbi:MAG: response regulator [Desulfobacterota bacterium]|nr:response regulator [Thermodesulfobacteriota bacterium]